MKPPFQLPPTRAGCCLALACGLLALPLAATASDDQDHELARSALVRGEVLPLKTVMERLDKERPGGQILEVELERKQGGWVYEIKQMEAGGQLVKIKLDARTGELLERSPRKRPGAEPARDTPGGKP